MNKEQIEELKTIIKKGTVLYDEILKEKPVNATLTINTVEMAAAGHAIQQVCRANKTVLDGKSEDDEKYYDMKVRNVILEIVQAKLILAIEAERSTED